MKNFKRFTAAIAATLMAASLSIPMAMNAGAATETTGGNTITVTNKDGATHTYAAYQIFSGNFSGGTLNDIEWGDGVNSSTILTKLHEASADNTNALYGLFPDTVNSATKVAEVLGGNNGETPSVPNFTTDDAKAQAFAAIVGGSLAESAQTSGNVSGNTISNLPDGYYLVQDASAPSGGTNNSGAKTRFIVHVTDSETVTVDAKHSAPTVDKYIQDNETPDTTDEWGETADHAINESFQFKLTATLAADNNYGAYDTYMVQFNDTLSAGVTYENIASVKIGGTSVDAKSDTKPDGYELVQTPSADGGGNLTIKIADIKKFDTNLTDGATIEVIYNAHLNENATVEKGNNESAGTDYANANKVNLWYSNNPNASGTGEYGTTPDDYVWAFTLGVDNKKVDENNSALEGAGFKLYTDEAKTTAIKLIDNKDGTYTVAKQNATLTPEADIATTDKPVVEQMISNATGIFNIKGLDAGTYYLAETKVPGGYNKCADKKIEIVATHEENSGGTSAKLTLTKAEGMNNTIENSKGSSLPSTGGIGTTLFFVGGGSMVAVAGIFLITKKRMGKNAD